MKKALVMFLIFLFVIQPVGCLASFVIQEDFNEGTSLDYYGINLAGGMAELKKIPDGAKQLDALTLKDNSSEGGITLQRNIGKITGRTAVEVKIRIEEFMTNLNILLCDGSSVLSGITIGVAGDINVYDGHQTRKFDDTVAKLNNWIVFRFMYDPSSKKLDVRCNNEIKEALKPYYDFNGEGLDSIIIKTGTGTPGISIDYIYVEKGNELNAGIRPIIPGYVEPPAPHPVDGIINVLYNGDYKFFDYQPVIKNSRVLIPFRRIFDMLGMEVNYDDKTRTATGRNQDVEISITQGSYIATVNGVSHTMDVIPEIIENSFYVPVRFISQAVGKSVDWDEKTRTVVIND